MAILFGSIVFKETDISSRNKKKKKKNCFERKGKVKFKIIYLEVFIFIH